GGLEGLARLFVREFLRRELAQLLVDERQKLRGGAGVALLDGPQDVRDVGHAGEHTARVPRSQHAGGRSGQDYQTGRSRFGVRARATANQSLPSRFVPAGVNRSPADSVSAITPPSSWSWPSRWPTSCRSAPSRSMRRCSPWLPGVVNSLLSAGVGSTNQPQPAAFWSSQIVWPEARPSVVP